MKALTIYSWWAAAIVRGVKTTENRSWKPPLQTGDRFLVHAGARRVNRADTEALRGQLAEAGCSSDAALRSLLAAPQAAIVGVAEFLGADQDVTTPWDIPGLWHWRIGEVTPITPIPCGGALGLWTPAAGLLAHL